MAESIVEARNQPQNTAIDPGILKTSNKRKAADLTERRKRAPPKTGVKAAIQVLFLFFLFLLFQVFGDTV